MFNGNGEGVACQQCEFDMNMLEQLLDQCETQVQRDLLSTLFEKIEPKLQEELMVKYSIPGISTDIHFAFPKNKIAICCDEPNYQRQLGEFFTIFNQDRELYREMHLRDWIYLRFTFQDVQESNRDRTVNTILRVFDEMHGSLNEEAVMDAWYYEVMAKDDIAKGHYEEALEKLNRSIIRFPENYSVYHYRGVVYYNLDDYAHAIIDYTTAIALNAYFIPAYWGRGAAYAKIGDQTRKGEDYAMAEFLEKETKISDS